MQVCLFPMTNDIIKTKVAPRRRFKNSFKNKNIVELIEHSVQ